jgi:eukaryotic-like serine/threonine-protein kinase
VLAPGTTLSRYVVETPIGQGGMGAVYRARDTHLDRAVALKVLGDGAGGLPDKEARERLVREARAAASLSHPNAVAIYDAGDSEHGPFIVMELVEGETLRRAIERGASARQIVDWMKMAAFALGEAHERGIVHRDIKPDNLMLRRDGIAKVLDFGIARQGALPQDASAPTHAALPTLTGTGVQIGTPQYMAPEQIKGGKVDGRTDQFSWGVTAFEALTGRLPWQTEGGALGVVASILEDVPTSLDTMRSDVPPHVAAVIARAMKKKPDERFATMRDLIQALDGASEIPSVPPAPRPVQAPLPSETRFSDATMKAVIGKALSFQERGGYDKSELREAARELGIEESALEAAMSAVRQEKQTRSIVAADDALKERIIEARKRGFWKHLIAYVGVNLIIVMPGLMEEHMADRWAVFVPAIIWGIGLAIHAMSAFSSKVTQEVLSKARQKEERAFAKDASHRASLAANLEKQARRAELKRGAAAFGTAVEQGVASMLNDAAAKLRDGVVSSRPPQERVRVASSPPQRSDTVRAEHEAQAEEEARANDRRARR